HRIEEFSIIRADSVALLEQDRAAEALAKSVDGIAVRRLQRPGLGLGRFFRAEDGIRAVTSDDQAERRAIAQRFDQASGVRRVEDVKAAVGELVDAVLPGDTGVFR